ncbi:uncharacterized protein LOC119267521 [Triticum dicoccoides]|uniref:uncharacterized protein LOC119267521 n=1 Tax=Triticum dicoccoides TaxID=85692 RepID=UPI000E78E0B3|nr:uncharacterized protein LOC119267521 [Triticum dicoccoides]
MPKPSTQPSGITLQIGQTSPKESSAMQDSDKKLLDKCVKMILGMTTNPPPANDNNQSLSHAINEVLTETLEQTLALAEIETQCTTGDIESSSCQSTQQEVANVAQNDLTGQKEEESQDHPSNNSVAEVSSERTEDDDISKVGKKDSNSHTSHLTPRHNFRDIEIVHIAEEPSSPKTIDCKHISKLAEPLPDGECFDYAGSINPSMKMRKQRYQKKDEITEGISEIVKKKQYPMKKLNNLYNTLVASSKFRGLRRTRRHEDNDTGGTKIRIGPASATERELVQCLMPKGKMCKNMMWLLSVALMYDWGSKTKVILDQTIITELLKNPKKCNHLYLCKKLSKLALQNVEQIFLPTLYDYHWILAVINLMENTIEIYDSNLEVKEGEDPHKVILENMANNRQKALNDYLQKSAFAFMDFPRKCSYAGKQTNNDDCGFWVIKVLLCHNGKELIGNYKWAMDVFRKEICYILVYHRFNDLNPRRPEIKKISSSMKTTTD